MICNWPPNESTLRALSLRLPVQAFFRKFQANGNFNGGKRKSPAIQVQFSDSAADAAFQLDFFGRLRRATEAARAQLLATEDARQDVT